MDEAPQGRLRGAEELHCAFRHAVPVADIRIDEVPSAAHHITHVGLFDVLCRAEAGFKQLLTSF